MIPKDKIAHAVAGLLVALGALALFVIYKHAGLAAAVLAAGVAVGVVYELVQKLRGEGQPDAMDALATAIGAACVAALVQVTGWSPL